MSLFWFIVFGFTRLYFGRQNLLLGRQKRTAEKEVSAPMQNEKRIMENG